MTLATTRLLMLAAAVEAATGLALVARPALVAELVFGYGASGAGIALGRVAGIGLLSLGVACWPVGASAIRAMLVYNLLTTFYLAYLGFRGQLVGVLLWPAAVFHAIMTALFARAHHRNN